MALAILGKLSEGYARNAGAESGIRRADLTIKNKYIGWISTGGRMMIRKILHKIVTPQLPDLMAMGSLACFVTSLIVFGIAIDHGTGYFSACALFADAVLLFVMWIREGGR